MPANEAGVLWMPNGNGWSGRNGYQPRWVILHGTAGGTSAQAIANYFKSTEGSDNPVSSHYIIGQDGVIVQCIDEGDSAWANGGITAGADPWWSLNINPNLLTISIEHVKPSADNSDAITAPQQAASFKLIRDICMRHQIPMRSADASGGITGHYSMDPVNRSRCPGSYPWSQLWSNLEGVTAVGIPQGWKDDGHTLTAPNGVQITDGFRLWVLAHQWDASNVPLMSAQALNPVEVGNPSLGAGTVQPFLTCVLAWTQNKGVYLMWVGQEYVALYNRAHDLQTQLATVQKQAIAALAQAQDLQAKVTALQAQLAQNTDAQKLADLTNRLTQIHTISTIS